MANKTIFAALGAALGALLMRLSMANGKHKGLGRNSLAAAGGIAAGAALMHYGTEARNKRPRS